MKGAEKILMIMREQGKHGNKKGLQLAMMESDGICVVGDLEVERSDYLMAEDLKLKKGDTVVVNRMSDELYVILAKVV